MYSGQNNSSASYLSNTTTSKDVPETTSTLFKTTPLIFSTLEGTSYYVTNTTTHVEGRNSLLLITSILLQSTSSKLHLTSSSSFLSTTVSGNLSIASASYVSSSKIPSKSSIFSSTVHLSLSQTKTLESPISSYVYSSVFTTTNFSFPATLFTSSISFRVNSSLTHDSTALRPNYSTSTLSSMHRTTIVSSRMPHFSTSPVMSTITVSLLTSPRERHSSVATSTAHVPSRQFSSFGISTTLLLLVKSSQSSAVSFSATFPARTKVTMTSSPKSSTANTSAATSLVLLQSSPQTLSLRLTISPHSNTLESLKITTVKPSLSDQSNLHSKTSQVKSHNTLTKISSSDTKQPLLSSVSVINNILVQFDGKLVVSPKLSFKKEHDLKIFADSIEGVLNEALNEVNGFVYSKVLVITQNNEDMYDCLFQIVMRKPSSETGATLQERISKFNETNGFGQFMLHFVETRISASHDSSPKASLYLWAIIVIAALGVICFLLLVAFIYTRVCNLINCFHVDLSNKPNYMGRQV